MYFTAQFYGGRQLPKKGTDNERCLWLSWLLVSPSVVRCVAGSENNFCEVAAFTASISGSWGQIPGNVSHWWSCSSWAEEMAGLYCCVKCTPEISSNFWWQVIWERMVLTAVVARAGQPSCEGGQLHSEVHGLTYSSAPLEAAFLF